MKEGLKKDCLGEGVISTPAAGTNPISSPGHFTAQVPCLQLYPKGQGWSIRGLGVNAEQKLASRPSNFSFNDLDKAKFQQTLCYLLENAFLFYFFTKRFYFTLLHRQRRCFSLSCSFFDIFQILEG